MKKPPAFQFYPKDFLMDDKVIVMNLEEIGAFIKLLCYCWNNNGLTNNQNELKNMCGNPENWERIWGKVGKCFYEKNEKFYNKRLEKEFKKQKLWRKKSQLGGIQSGISRGKKVQPKLKDGSDKDEPKSNSSSSSSSPTPISSSSSKDNVELQKQIIDFFNEVTNQKRSYTCDGTNKLINGRLSEGRTIDDFKHVIDTKYTQWRNDEKMSQFIRPSTLFRPENFENYLNEPYEDPKKKILKVGESTHVPSKKEDDYTKARAIKMKEVEKKYQLEIDNAMKAKNLEWMDEIDNKIKEEIAEFSREYHKKEE